MKRGLALLLSVSLMLAAAPSVSTQAANQGAAASGESIESVTEDRSVPAAAASEGKGKADDTGASAASAGEKTASAGETAKSPEESDGSSGKTAESAAGTTKPSEESEDSSSGTTKSSEESEDSSSETTKSSEESSDSSSETTKSSEESSDSLSGTTKPSEGSEDSYSETSESSEESAEASSENAGSPEGPAGSSGQETQAGDAAAQKPAEKASEKTESVSEITAESVQNKADAALNGFVTENGKRFFYEDGKKKTGWITYKNATYYMKANGEMAVGFTKISGEGTFYFMDSSCAGYSPQKEGQMLTGFRTIGGRRYYLADARTGGYKRGERLTGWQTISGKVYYFADGDYTLLPTGAQLTGFRTIKGNRYYFADVRCKALPTGARATGFRTIGGKRYYFVSSGYPHSKVIGKMLTGIKTIGGKAYYFNSRGVMKTGWIRISDRMAYYTKSGPARKAGWKSRDGDWYYLGKNGKAKIGWLRPGDGSIYYLDKSAYGRMADAPAKIKNKIYFFDEDGRRATTEGWKSFGDYYYYTYENGTVAVDTTIDGIRVDNDGKVLLSGMDLKAQNYGSNTSFLILVNKSLHKVCIYQREGGFWRRIRECWCGDGKSSTPTIEGSFTVGLKMLYFDSGSARCWYATQFCGNYLFHSVLYYRDSGPYSVMDGRVGVGVSHGCVRMQIDNARWIYNNIPRGTKVVVYR